MLQRRKLLLEDSFWEIMDNYVCYDDYVDLGLPSGTLWATCDIGAMSPEETGLFFMRGETQGYTDADDRNRALGRDDGFSYESAVATGATNVKYIPLSIDPARINMGYPWRLPTFSECDELVSNTKGIPCIVNGVYCVKLKSTINDNFIIFPFTGQYEGTYYSLEYDILYKHLNGLHLSSDTYESWYGGFSFYVSESSKRIEAQSDYYNFGWVGLTMRAVYD